METYETEQEEEQFKIFAKVKRFIWQQVFSLEKTSNDMAVYQENNFLQGNSTYQKTMNAICY